MIFTWLPGSLHRSKQAPEASQDQGADQSRLPPQHIPPPTVGYSIWIVRSQQHCGMNWYDLICFVVNPAADFTICRYLLSLWSQSKSSVYNLPSVPLNAAIDQFSKKVASLALSFYPISMTTTQPGTRPSHRSGYLSTLRLVEPRCLESPQFKAQKHIILCHLCWDRFLGFFRIFLCLLNVDFEFLLSIILLSIAFNMAMGLWRVQA